MTDDRRSGEEMHNEADCVNCGEGIGDRSDKAIPCRCGIAHPMNACEARSLAIDEGLAIGLGLDTKDVTEGQMFYTLDELCRVRAFALQEGLERGAAAIVGVTEMAMAILHRPCGTGGCVRFQTTGACWKVKR